MMTDHCGMAVPGGCAFAQNGWGWKEKILLSTRYLSVLHQQQQVREKVQYRYTFWKSSIDHFEGNFAPLTYNQCYAVAESHSGGGAGELQPSVRQVFTFQSNPVLATGRTVLGAYFEAPVRRAGNHHFNKQFFSWLLLPPCLNQEQVWPQQSWAHSKPSHQMPTSFQHFSPTC